LLRRSGARIHLHIPVRGADTDPCSYCDRDSYTHANHDTNTHGNSNCDCHRDPCCNIYSHSYTQAIAYTKSCSDAAAAAHRATAPGTGRLEVLGERRLLTPVIVGSLSVSSSKALSLMVGRDRRARRSRRTTRRSVPTLHT
jgi:hypothetical protein